MAYTKNKVYSGVDNNGREYNYEATTHLGVDINDILDLRASLFKEIGGDFGNLYDFVNMSLGKYGINIAGKNTVHGIQVDLSEIDGESLIKDCEPYIYEGEMYAVYRLRDMLTYMRTYYNIARKVGSQLDTYINEFLLRRIQPYNEILSLPVLEGKVGFERFYFYEGKDKLDCTTKLRNNLARGIENTIYFAGETNKMVRKGELEKALKENGLSYDDVFIDLMEDGFVRSYLKDLRTFHIYSDESKVQEFNFGLDLNFTTSISFIGTSQGVSFEDEIMSYYESNNYFLSLLNFYKEFLAPAVEVYKYIEQKLNANKEIIFEIAQREGNYCITGEYQIQKKEVSEIEIEIFSPKYKKMVSIVEYLSVLKRLCKLDSLKFIFDPPEGDKIKTRELKFSEVFVK